MLPLTDFSGKNSLTCRDQAGQSQGDAVCTEQDWRGWRHDRECQQPPNTAPCPQRPPARSTVHTPFCQPIFHTHPALSFGFSRCLEGPRGAGGSPSAPSPKAACGVGLHRLSTKECGSGWGRRRLQTGELRARSRAGWGKPQQPRAVCEAAGHGGSLRDVPVVEDRLSPQPPPRAVAGAAAALPQRRPGRSRCNHGLINALGNFTVCSWHCSS